VMAFGFPFVAWGLIYNLWFCVFGGICIVGAIYGWVMEPSSEPEAGHEQPDDIVPEAPSAEDGRETVPTEEAVLVD
jgi:cytochrome c oxidase subunit 1